MKTTSYLLTKSKNFKTNSSSSWDCTSQRDLTFDMRIVMLDCILQKDNISKLGKQCKFPFYVLHDALIDGLLFALNILHVSILIVVEKGLLVLQTLIIRLKLQDHHLKLIPLDIFLYFNRSLLLPAVVID
jgi:hypothetical protein